MIEVLKMVSVRKISIVLFYIEPKALLGFGIWIRKTFGGAVLFACASKEGIGEV